VPLSTAYSVAEAFEQRADLNDSFREAPLFYATYGACAVVAVTLVLIPGAPLIPILFLSQALNAVLLLAILPFLRALAPGVPAASLLESATREGARALGFDADYGTIEPGKSARLIAVALPSPNIDVEEYLVSGIEAPQIRWIDEVPGAGPYED